MLNTIIGSAVLLPLSVILNRFIFGNETFISFASIKSQF